MKKTLIAMAVAGVVAAPIASADVTVSGVVEQTFTDTDNDANGMDSSTDSGITFKGSEDLGNGMTAFAQITLDTDNAGGTADEKDSKAGISGDFGTIVVGRMEDFTEGKLAAMMTLNGTGAVELAGNAGRTNGAVAYVSPTVAGFHAGVAGYTGAGVADTDTFDATDLLIAYANGPLSIMASHETLNPLVADATAEAVAGTATVEQKTTSVGASYTLGDLKLSVLSVSRDDQAGVSGADSDDTMYRVDYTMGNNKFTLAGANDDSANNDIGAFEITHSLSSRTSAYIGFTNQDTANTDSTYVGMIHKF